MAAGVAQNISFGDCRLNLVLCDEHPLVQRLDGVAPPRLLGLCQRHVRKRPTAQHPLYLEIVDTQFVLGRPGRKLAPPWRHAVAYGLEGIHLSQTPSQALVHGWEGRVHTIGAGEQGGRCAAGMGRQRQRRNGRRRSHTESSLWRSPHSVGRRGGLRGSSPLVVDRRRGIQIKRIASRGLLAAQHKPTLGTFFGYNLPARLRAGD
mmetsp:Transcript_4049/g.12501  ORF Transcript_4049/g.12501 Transcript_4049/m.12501 type:complete len:205 (-) Transcript_4049:141-755(-)